MPLLQQSRPVAREVLCHRLERLSLRAGVPVLGVHELPLGERTRRASAALVGAGSTRRILLSDTLLSNYSDDEIEVVMAHEIGHHVHRHLLKATIAEILLLLVGFRAAAAALDGSWQWLGLTSPGDVAGMPLMLIVVGAVLVATTPLLNWWSRSQERRADRFALENASQPAAFIDAVRRMSAQNLAEDRPSSAAFLFFHTHPTAEERIAAARDALGQLDRAPRFRRIAAGLEEPVRNRRQAAAGSDAPRYICCEAPSLRCGRGLRAAGAYSGSRRAPLPDDQRALHLAAALVLLEVAVELEAARPDRRGTRR